MVSGLNDCYYVAGWEKRHNIDKTREKEKPR